jgi:hypothetical protein
LRMLSQRGVRDEAHAGPLAPESASPPNMLRREARHKGAAELAAAVFRRRMP